MKSASLSQKQFLSLAVPNMLAGLSVPLTQLVDLAYLGHLESIIPLSGVVLATVIFDYIYWCFAFLRMGTTGLTAQAVGRESREEQVAIFWRAILIGLLIGIMLTLLRAPIGDISFLILAGDAEVEAAGREFFNTHILGAIPVMLNLAIIGWLLGHGKSGLVWVLYVLWQLANMVLNYFFIVRFGWGAWGAGLGTALAEWFSLLTSIAAVWFYWKGFPLFDKQRILHWPEFKVLLSLNSAIMLRTFMLMSVLSAFTNISATISTIALAANALMMKLYIFSAFVLDGYSIALETLAGQSLGRKNKEQLKRALSLTYQWSAGSSLLFILLYIAAAGWVLSLLTEHAEIIAAALPYVPWLCATIFLGAFAFTLDGFFYGLAKPKLLFYSMALAGIAFAPPAYYAWLNKDSTLLWIAFVVFTAVRVATLLPAAQKAVR